MSVLPAICLVGMISAFPSAAPQVRPTGTQLTLEVVERKSGVPVPHAKVWRLPDSTRALSELTQDLDPWSAHKSTGALLICDGGGRVTLAGSEEEQNPATILVHADELWGSERLPRDSSIPLRIELIPERRLDVEVVDTKGRPMANVPLVLRAHGIPGLRRHGHTGADGHADFRRLLTRDFRDPGDKDWTLRFDFLVPGPLTSKLGLPAGVTSKTKLILPELGQVSVHVDGADGRPYMASGNVTLQLAGEPKEEGQGRTLRAGKAYFDRVASGHELIVTVATAEHGRRELRVPGPATDGDSVVVVVDWVPTTPILVGRVVGPEGRPLSGRLLTGRIGDYFLSVRLDMEGGFRVALGPRQIKQASGVHIAEFDSKSSNSRRAPLFGSHQVRINSEPGEVDLGEIQLESMQLVVSGQILDPEGKPLAGSAIGNGLLSVTHLEHKTARYSCEPEADGSFWIYAPDASGEWKIEYISYQKFALDRKQVTGRSEDLRLETYRPRTRKVQLLVGDNVDLSRVRIRFDVGKQRRSCRIEESGLVVIPRLAPGSWDLVASSAGFSSRAPMLSFGERENLERIGGLVFDERGYCADERLDTIDLRERLFAFPFSIEDENGQAIEGCSITMGNRVKAPAGMAWEGGTIYSDVPQLDFFVSAPSYRSVILRGAMGPQRVRLARGIEVHFELPAALALPPAGTRLRLELFERLSSKQFGDVRSTGTAKGHFADDELVLRVPSTGHYVLKLWLEKEGRMSLLTRGEFRPFRVDETGSEVVPIRVLKEWLDDARREVEE